MCLELSPLQDWNQIMESSSMGRQDYSTVNIYSTRPYPMQKLVVENVYVHC
jgi:hypothetical protein